MIHLGLYNYNVDRNYEKKWTIENDLLQSTSFLKYEWSIVKKKRSIWNANFIDDLSNITNEVFISLMLGQCNNFHF